MPSTLFKPLGTFLTQAFFVFRLVFLGFLTLLFAIALCVTHPIFVFTTAFSVTVSVSKMSFAIFKRWLKGEKLFSSGDHQIIVVDNFRDVTGHSSIADAIDVSPVIDSASLSVAPPSRSRSKIIELSKNEYFGES